MPLPAETTRFAPNPTGLLHLGHAYSALFARKQAGMNGRFIVRIEDIDPGRCRPEFEAAIKDDLAWLGLAWEVPVRRQSEHMAEYAGALTRLKAMDLLYPCFCTRREIAEEIAAAGHAPHGPDGPLYPGTCRRMAEDERRRRLDADESFALRLDVARAVALTGPLDWVDLDRGTVTACPESFGDVVLARKDVPVSYHLAVTLDDHLQGVTLVTRGEDLFAASHLHRLLQALLGLDVPRWQHHRLLTDEQGRRLAKRDRAATIKSLREAGLSPEAVRAMAGFE